ncbi:hypothetical protein B0T16DRAFT_389115 [Cercophora newfieldiana]|uniref:Methyltransferase type 11 domain-containing protein n=1 Tax=Cercophora newfieldiana TaxID=92897 RepID=A0AA39YAB6_9PEZI|nr:hypothetical protein B0T16DRAFT_389115 [Cercophora newfieldiana]
MFSADLTWTPVAEVGPKRSDSRVSRPPSEADTDRGADWEAQSPVTLGNSVSVTSSASSRKLSVFRWSKGRRSGASSHGETGSIRRRTSVSVAEMPEDRGPERHELPAATQSSPPARPSATSPTSTKFPSHAFPLSEGRFEYSQSSRYQSPTSTHGSMGIASAPDRMQQARNLKTPENERSPSDNWVGNWRQPESGSSSRGSIAITDYPESSPRTTMLSQSRPGSSVLDGLSPPPKSPARAKPTPNITDTWPPRPNSNTSTQDSLLTLVRRMPSASAITRWNRISEEWIEPLDPRDRREISLEKDLWLLTELSLRDAALPTSNTPVRTSVGPTLPVHAVQRSTRILDVCSRPADLFHLAALQPGARIAHLSTGTEDGVEQSSLPHNVAGVSLITTQGVAFPLGDGSFDHARVTPSAVGAFTAPQLKGLLRECQRVLAVRGMLEVRYVDPTPLDMGGNTARWVESELLVGMESDFKCTRPGVMVPVWAREAGLELMQGDGLGFHEFRVCMGEEASAEERLEVQLGRQLIRWQFPSVKTWLWEVEACRAECLERATRFCVTTLFWLKA